MRNYYDALGLDRFSSQAEVHNGIDALTPEQLADEGDLALIMQNEQWSAQYKRVHLQYEAMAAFMARQTEPSAENAHSWDKRVVEFHPEQDTIELTRSV